jgi:beta-fructofuranosidase
VSAAEEKTPLAEVPVARRIARDDEIPGNFRPAGGVLWDPWFLAKDGEHHVFYLQVPLLDDPEDRHHAGVSIGHAVSSDLRAWHERPMALTPGDGDDWDGLALWTGWVVEHEGRAFQFYTGRREREFWYQRIGLAVSTDGGLDRWEKQPDVVLAPDPRHYSTTQDLNALGVAPLWRDPCVFRVPGEDGWHMTISARTAQDAPHNACVAHARSADLVSWEILPPLLAPGVYDEMEATQVVRHDGRFYLFFSTWAVHYRPDWAHEHGAHSGLHCWVADDLDGEYRPVNGGSGVVLPDADRRYTVRLVERDGDDYTAMGWLNYDERNRFIGTLSDPLTVTIDGDTVTAEPSL